MGFLNWLNEVLRSRIETDIKWERVEKLSRAEFQKKIWFFVSDKEIFGKEKGGRESDNEHNKAICFIRVIKEIFQHFILAF